MRSARHALRSVLGEHVAQKGSVVAPDRLRFDFSHGRALTHEEIRKVEEEVNERVWRNEPVSTQVMDQEAARATGAIAFFGEKYGDQVRVVRMTDSMEFCGGTHVRATGDIGLFKITDESGISQGTRRIVAVTGPGALEYVQQIADTVEQLAERVRGTPEDVIEKVDRLREENRTLQRQLEELQRKLATSGARDLLADLREIGGIKVLATRTAVADPPALRSLGDELRGRLQSGVLALAGVADGKVSIVVMVTPDVTDRVSAKSLVEQVAPLVGGRGGGRPELAQGSGNDPGGVDAALQRVYELVDAAVGGQGANGADAGS
jgi:alanyl-tRNA synthetase